MSIVIMQARMSSTRFPGKVMQRILGIPMFVLQYLRIAEYYNKHEIWVATSNEESDDPIAEECRKNGINCYRGSLNDVAQRFIDTWEASGSKESMVVRVTCDCPLISGDLIVKTQLQRKDELYFSTCGNLPDGFDIEFFDINLLRNIDERAKRLGCSEEAIKDFHEHVTLFYATHPHYQSIRGETNFKTKLTGKFSVDTRDDFEAVKNVFEHFGYNEFGFEEVEELFAVEDEILRIGE